MLKPKEEKGYRPGNEGAEVAAALAREVMAAPARKSKPEHEPEGETAEREQPMLPGEGEDDALFADIGMVDPYTGEPIETKADFLRWKEHFLADMAPGEEDEVDYLTLDPMAGDYADRQVVGRLEQAIASELDKIRQWDSAVSALEDIAAAEVFPAIYEKVMRGYSLSDAFYLANADRLQQDAVTRAEDVLRRRLESKEHLRTVKNRGGGEEHIPAEVMAEFKRLMPEADVGAIRRFYRKDRGRRVKA